LNFVDEVRIHVKAGDGGPGAVAFRREKFAPRGGPSGGDGGRGGTIFLEADENATTLLDYRFKPIHRAKSGEPGKGSDCNGRDGADVVLKVPVGTVTKSAESGEALFDLARNGERVVLAQGGKGGLGNMNFATATRQAPRFAQPGTPGEEKDVILELKLLADVGLLGYPNAGKSTLISRVSRARPKIADYPFTTLTPHLGVVAYKDNLSFVMADIPGLIEGAHAGAGLGHQFLKHVERCRLLIHLVDCAAQGEGRRPLHDLEAINRELELHDPELARKPQIVVANKIDVTEAREKASELVQRMKRRKVPVVMVSAATGEGLETLLDMVAKKLFSRRPTGREKP
jgi:GTP-binding protein